MSCHWTTPQWRPYIVARVSGPERDRDPPPADVAATHLAATDVGPASRLHTWILLLQVCVRSCRGRPRDWDCCVPALRAQPRCSILALWRARTVRTSLRSRRPGRDAARARRRRAPAHEREPAAHRHERRERSTRPRLCLIDQVRAAHGLRPLKANRELQSVAVSQVDSDGQPGLLRRRSARRERRPAAHDRGDALRTARQEPVDRGEHRLGHRSAQRRPRRWSRPGCTRRPTAKSSSRANSAKLASAPPPPCRRCLGARRSPARPTRSSSLARG